MPKKKVLVIDDDRSMLELAEFHLQAQGYESARAETGEEGLKLVEGSRFDVILTDLQLPDLGGIEVVKRLKEISPDSEIIMISGHGSVAKAVEATKAGAFFFVEKPVELGLMARLRPAERLPIKSHRSSRANPSTIYEGRSIGQLRFAFKSPRSCRDHAHSRTGTSARPSRPRPGNPRRWRTPGSCPTTPGHRRAR